ncbi:GDP-mannose:glycolipid 4-beta-D-mannosyltransferase [Microbacterium nanhaiense]|uniref:GDP-mannose:glycolipid 4-beta-D-mannosyltransferase n=1 Tax=Microbacterium nanhaiense TaxID=1301026 RepID=A0ABQ2N655_9MICO|nr:glycosyltransferase [Microbacterium nanhaiense]GGO66950.1 GDP-mannose:glycolipid 4-beta-D-mannosyltransferase [Microbacterium nanhaiense]
MPESVPITVMQSLAAPSQNKPTSNPYTRLLVESMPAERVHTKYFRWSGFLFDQFDVLHVHWPEVLVRHPRKIVHFAKCVALRIFLARIRLQKKAIVRTVHNVEPHEPGSRIESRVLAALDRQTDVRIVLNEATPNPLGTPTVLVPHGHYRDWYDEPSSDRIVSGNLLTFGFIRAYKGVDDLLSAFRETMDQSLTLTIAGRADSHQTSNFIEEQAALDSRISLDLRFIPDNELASHIARAEVVILPYREVHNSGAALLALSMNRPVLMRRSDSTLLLQAEFGAEWVILFDGILTHEVIERTVSAIRATPRSPRADMSSREWPLLADKTIQAYEIAHKRHSKRNIH